MSKNYYRNFDETVYDYTLENGFKVHLIPKSNFSSTYVYLITHLGSFNENDEVVINDKHYKVRKGVAHFIEHRLFDYQGEDTFKKFQEDGVEANAYTTYKYTCYHLRIFENFKRNLDLLLNMFFSFEMDKNNVEKERKIILEEYYDALNPSSNLYQLLYANSFLNHPIKSHVLGDEETINNLSYEELKAIHDAYYSFENSEIFIVGNFKKDYALKIIKDNLKNKKLPNYKIIPYSYDEPLNVIKKEESVTSYVPSNSYCYLLKMSPLDFSLKPKEYYKAISVLLQASLGSSKGKLNRQINDKNIALGGSYFYFYFDEKINFLEISNEYVLKKKAYLKIIDDFLDNHLNYLPSAREFELIRKSLLSSYLAKFDILGRYIYEYVSLSVEGVDYFKYYDYLKNISYEEALEFLKQITKASKSIYLLNSEN